MKLAFLTDRVTYDSMRWTLAFRIYLYIIIRVKMRFFLKECRKGFPERFLKDDVKIFS